jgi:hypothetical protein
VTRRGGFAVIRECLSDHVHVAGEPHWCDDHVLSRIVAEPDIDNLADLEAVHRPAEPGASPLTDPERNAIAGIRALESMHLGREPINAEIEHGRRAALGHEERFRPTTLSAGGGFRKETIAGTRRNGRDATPHVLDRELNHVSGTIKGVAAVYNRHQYLPERKAALEACDAMWRGSYTPTGPAPMSSRCVLAR